jgi:integrase
MKRPQRTRLYTRAAGRYYADLRAFADVGGKQEAMIPKGEKRATTDHSTAVVLMAARITELEAARKGRTLAGLARVAVLKPYAEYHLAQKTREVEAQWLESQSMFLGRAVKYLGGARGLHTITVAECQAWARFLADEGLSGGTVRHHLNALSGVYRRAESEGVVAPGFNPIRSMLKKPTGAAAEARWLEISDASLLLEAARTMGPNPKGGPHGAGLFVYPLVATFLLTGGREAEILGLELDDVSFDRETITFRPNQWRRLKTRGSSRVVPLWPQLRDILQPYVDQRVIDRGGTLLFPAMDLSMITDWRKLLDRVAVRAGWRAGEVRSRIFRNTYAAARLQTTDHGAPVAVWTVSRELGHTSTALVERVYGHLGVIRHRAEVVEYCVEQHAEALSDRLKALRPAKAA